MDVIAKELTTYEVGTDGNWFRMNFTTADGGWVLSDFQLSTFRH